VNNVQSANNDRVNVIYDIRLNQDWFIRPVQLEYYHDSLANISYRITAGVGAGYYIFDRNDLEWIVSAGPSYQYTKFSTVETNESDSASAPAAVLNSNFKYDITRRLTLKQSWQSIFTEKDAGQYTHHSVSTLEFEIKRHLNLDVSFTRGEEMRTEVSAKFRREGVAAELDAAGFDLTEWWTDSEGRFGLSLATAR